MGVRPGIAIAQATELANSKLARGEHSHCKSGDSENVAPLVAEHDPIADAVEIDRLAESLQQRICPHVAIETLDKRPWAGRLLTEPDTLFCDLTGVTHLFGDESGVIDAVHRCLSESGYGGKLAVADNAAAAWSHAHYNPAADFLSMNLADDLQGLSVNALRIPTETKYTLDRLGVETIGSLMRLPRDGLARRLGSGLVNRLAEVRGELEVPLQYFHAERQYQETHNLEYPTNDLAIVADRIRQLTGRVVAALSDHQRGAMRLACHLDLIDHPRVSTVIGLFAPTQDRNHLGCLITASVESVRVPAPITHIGLSVLQSGPMRTRQTSLLAEDAFAIEPNAVTNQTLARLVDSLTGRLGRDAVLGIRSSDNPLPEKAYRTYSLTDHRTRKALSRLPSKQRPRRDPAPTTRTSSARGFYAESTFRPPGRDDARRRPLSLLRKPVTLAAVSNANRKVDSATELPSFRLDGRVHQIAYFWGPERIETGWWDGPTVRRDYYRVETDNADLWWIYRDLRTEGWFLHGRFS